MIDLFGVVVPAHNEEDLLSACLDALSVAARRCAEVNVRVVVVLDDCCDGSNRIVADRTWAESLHVKFHNVGAARAAGCDYLLRTRGSTSLERVWLAATDADSLVPSDWVSTQLELAAQGWEASLGTVRIHDWADNRALMAPWWSANYSAVENHPHVHGANLGLRADVYQAVGGWKPLMAHEDVALVNALSGRRIQRTAAIPVTTSARTKARAPRGFGDLIRGLATSAVRPPGGDQAAETTETGNPAWSPVTR